WGAWGALRIIGASTGNHANVSSNGDQGQDGFVYVTLTNSCGQDSYYGPDYIPCEYDYLMVYPNPTSDELFISLDDNSNSSKSDQTYEIQLFNDKQEKVFSLRNNEKITKISTKNFQKGAYILRVNHNNGKEERRIILQ
ncbi:MAG TPA: T9SS type A sorting domain-containing protein, partial [Cyclobacteriaceae bacterium]|nr:T9SS type A sorting domain-containing protein [Cyclobacteriaceae bacterium]